MTESRQCPRLPCCRLVCSFLQLSKMIYGDMWVTSVICWAFLFKRRMSRIYIAVPCFPAECLTAKVLLGRILSWVLSRMINFFTNIHQDLGSQLLETLFVYLICLIPSLWSSAPMSAFLECNHNYCIECKDDTGSLKRSQTIGPSCTEAVAAT